MPALGKSGHRQIELRHSGEADALHDAVPEGCDWLVVDQVAAGLAQRGHRVTVYASYEDGTYADRPYRLQSFGVPVTKWAATYDLRAWRQALGAQLTSVHHEGGDLSLEAKDDRTRDLGALTLRETVARIRRDDGFGRNDRILSGDRYSPTPTRCAPSAAG